MRNARFERSYWTSQSSQTLLAGSVCFPGLMMALLFCFSWLPTAEASKERLIVFHFKENARFNSTDAAWVKRLTRWALHRQPGFAVVPTSVLSSGSGGGGLSTKDKVRLTLLRKNIKHAKVLYRFRKYAYSIKRLKLAMKLHKAVFRHVTDSSLLRDVYVYMAVNALYMRQGKVTREYVLKAIHFDGGYTPSPSQFPSTFVTYYNSVRGWLQRQPSYSLRMDTVPQGGRVYYNFKYVGRAPITVRGMKPGKHQFHVMKKGYQTWDRIATINPQQLGNRRLLQNAVTLKKDPNTLSLQGVPVFARGADLDPGLLRRLQRICIKANTKHLFVIRPLQRGRIRYLKLARFRRDERTIRYRLVPIGNQRSEHRKKVLGFAATLSRALVPAAHRRVAVVPRRVAPVVVRRQPPPRRRLWEPPRRRRPVRRPVVARVEPPPRRTQPAVTHPPAHQTWWFWTSIVGGVAVAATATVVVIIMTQPPPSATFIIATPNQSVSSSLTKR
jgi:hypothetical protein